MGSAAFAKLRIDTTIKTTTKSEQKIINEYLKKMNFFNINKILLYIENMSSQL